MIGLKMRLETRLEDMRVEHVSAPDMEVEEMDMEKVATEKGQEAGQEGCQEQRQLYSREDMARLVGLTLATEEDDPLLGPGHVPAFWMIQRNGHLLLVTRRGNYLMPRVVDCMLTSGQAKAAATRIALDLLMEPRNERAEEVKQELLLREIFRMSEARDAAEHGIEAWTEALTAFCQGGRACADCVQRAECEAGNEIAWRELPEYSLFKNRGK